jgi:hypothetical protein
MTMCSLHDAGAIELYFYGELSRRSTSPQPRRAKSVRVRWQ